MFCWVRNSQEPVTQTSCLLPSSLHLEYCFVFVLFVRNGSSRFWLQLKVHTNSSDEDEERRWYPSTCYTQESCRLFCPAVDVPAEDTPSISSRGVAWHRVLNRSTPVSHVLLYVFFTHSLKLCRKVKRHKHTTSSPVWRRRTAACTSAPDLTPTAVTCTTPALQCHCRSNPTVRH